MSLSVTTLYCSFSSCSINLRRLLGVLGAESDQPSITKAVAYLKTLLTKFYLHFFIVYSGRYSGLKIAVVLEIFQKERPSG
jgi:hypothetical protein